MIRQHILLSLRCISRVFSAESEALYLKFYWNYSETNTQDVLLWKEQRQDAAIKPENKPIKTLKTRSSVFAAGLFVSEKQKRKRTQWKFLTSVVANTFEIQDFILNALNVSPHGGGYLSMLLADWLQQLWVSWRQGCGLQGQRRGWARSPEELTSGHFYAQQWCPSRPEQSQSQIQILAFVSPKNCRDGTDLGLCVLLHVVQSQSRKLFGPLLQQVDVANRVGQRLYHIWTGVI